MAADVINAKYGYDNTDGNGILQQLIRKGERFMPMPTRKEVLAELANWKRNSNMVIAHKASNVFNRFGLLSTQTPNEAVKLEKYLSLLLNQSINPSANEYPAFLKTVYKTLLVMGIEFPVNTKDKDSGEIMDMIYSIPIAPENLYVSSDRYNWDIKSLIKWKQTKESEWGMRSQRSRSQGNFVFLNPFTNVPFTARDLETMERIAMETKTILPPPRARTKYFQCHFFNSARVQPTDEMITEQLEQYERNPHGSTITVSLSTGFLIPGALAVVTMR